MGIKSNFAGCDLSKGQSGFHLMLKEYNSSSKSFQNSSITVITNLHDFNLSSQFLLTTLTIVRSQRGYQLFFFKRAYGFQFSNCGMRDKSLRQEIN